MMRERGQCVSALVDAVAPIDAWLSCEGFLPVAWAA